MRHLKLLLVAYAFIGFSGASMAQESLGSAMATVAEKIKQDAGVLGFVAMVSSSGYDHIRSSGLFSTDRALGKTKFLQFFVVQNGQYENRILFNVRKDIKNWWDRDWLKSVQNGDVVPLDRHRKLYISKPNGAGGNDFYVIVVARSDNPYAKKKKR